MGEHQHDHERAIGGFWVKPDGSTVPVESEAGHWRTATDVLKVNGYTGAYAVGCVHVSFCAGEWRMNFTGNATVDALRTAAALLRHYAKRFPNFYLEDWADYLRCDRRAYLKEEGEEGAEKVRAYVMQRALEKNAKAKRAQEAA